MFPANFNELADYYRYFERTQIAIRSHNGDTIFGIHFARFLRRMATHDTEIGTDGRTERWVKQFCILLEQTQIREPYLLNNSAMLAAVYLDPRYKFKLSTNEIQIAKLSLESLLQRVRRSKLQQSQPKESVVDEDSFEEECVRSGLARASYGANLNSSEPIESESGSESLFAEYEKISRIHHKSSLLQFWHDHSNNHPVLYELACIIYSIPPSQTTVERSFSILGFIYNCRRNRLSPQHLEDILMIILNRDMVEIIHKRDLQALSTSTQCNMRHRHSAV